MPATSVDAVVLGMGPGGEDVAGRLARAGLEVVGIDHGLVGGECPYWGCIPTKMMVRAADLLAEARRVPGVAGTTEVSPDWAPVARRIREQATDDWDDTVAVERFEEAGGTFVRGRGLLVAPDCVEVDGRRFQARRAIIVATGTTPSIPPVDGLDAVDYWTNREAVAAIEVPKRLLVLGAGAIGAELAQVFARFGSEVAVVEVADRLLPAEEPEAGEVLATAFAADGIDVHTGVGASSVAAEGDGVSVTLAEGTELHADRLLVATGRHADLEAIGAPAIDVDIEARWLPTDERLRVTDGVWAVGDVTGHGAFTHVAVHQAAIAAADILGEPHEPARYHAVPRVTFTDPEVGSVGHSVAEATERGLDVAVGRAQVPTTARGWLHATGNDGVITLVADRGRQALVGATSVGPTGGEVLGLLTLAVHATVPLSSLRSMIYAYPTFHRGVEDALRELEA